MTNPIELQTMLGTTIPVLDDGFVRLVDFMGSDAAIVQAARVSYGAGTKKVNEDRGLIRYLMRHSHTTPFEMCEVKLHLRAPMDVWRQWVRHRTASINEYSTRYSIAIDRAQTTRPDAWRKQSLTNRQGSEAYLDDTAGDRLSGQERELLTQARSVYEDRLAAGVAREQARKDLPLSTYTEAYWKIDLHNLFHFLALRMDAHAQSEIRGYATIIGEQIVAKWVPLAWEAFRDYKLNAMTLNAMDQAILRALTNNDQAQAIDIAERHGLLRRGENGRLSKNREMGELEAKLELLGLSIPWT